MNMFLRTVFIIIFTMTIIFTLIGLILPSKILTWKQPLRRTRKSVLLYSAIFLVSTCTIFYIFTNTIKDNTVTIMDNAITENKNPENKIPEDNKKNNAINNSVPLENSKKFVPEEQKGEPVLDTITSQKGTTTCSAKIEETATPPNLADEPTIAITRIEEEPDNLYVYFVDVPNGEAIYINYGEFDMLIDAGNSQSGEYLKNFLELRVKGNIEYVIATHKDETHIGGLNYILSNFTVDNIIDSGTINTEENKEYDALVNQDGINYQHDSDKTIKINEYLSFRIIETGDNYKIENNNSVVVQLNCNNAKFLFTGDMQQEAELANLSKFEDIDVLKVGNYGVNNATTNEFLEVIKPEYAVTTNFIPYYHLEQLKKDKTIEPNYYIRYSLRSDEVEARLGKREVIAEACRNDLICFDVYKDGSMRCYRDHDPMKRDAPILWSVKADTFYMTEEEAEEYFRKLEENEIKQEGVKVVEKESESENEVKQESMIKNDTKEIYPFGNQYKLLDIYGGNRSEKKQANVVVDIGFGERKYWGFTNEYGQLVKVIADEIILQDRANEPTLYSGHYYKGKAWYPDNRNTNLPLEPDYIISESLGGVANSYNLTLQNSTLLREQRPINDIEKDITEFGGCTDFSVIITYPNTKTKIPSHYKYTYTLDEKVINQEFDTIYEDTTDKESERNELNSNINISVADKNLQLITITNQGSDSIDLTGYWMYFHKTNTFLRFPAFVLKPGQWIKVGDSSKYTVDFEWRIEESIDWDSCKGPNTGRYQLTLRNEKSEVVGVLKYYNLNPEKNPKNISKPILTADGHVVIDELDKKNDYMTLTNLKNEPVYLIDYKIVSVNDNKTHTFEDFVILPGQTIYIGNPNRNYGRVFWWKASGGNEDTYKEYWDSSKSYTLQLVDSNGKLLSTLEN